RSQWRHQIPASFTSAAVKGCIGRIFQSVMEFTDRLTPEKHGRISDCATVIRSRNWRAIQRIRTGSLWPSLVIRTDLTRNEVFIDPWMAAKHSKRYYTAMRTSLGAMNKSIRAIRQLFTLLFGNRARDRGKMACSMETAAAFSNRSMVARRGAN